MSPPHITEIQALSVLNDTLDLPVHAVEHLKGGAWSTAFAFQVHEEAFVIRFSEHEDDFDRDAFACRFSTPDVPVPLVIHRGTYEKVAFAVSQRVPGRFIDDLDGCEYRRVLPSVLATLDGMRTADVSTTRGYGLWDAAGNGTGATWAGYLRTSLEDSPDVRGGSWRARLESSPTGAEHFDRDLRVLDRLLPNLPDLRHVVHSDLLNYNVFVDGDRISGVIDWGCAMYGDFLYELAWFAFWSPWYPQWSDIDVAKAARIHYAGLGVDLHDFDVRIISYQLHIGLGHQAYNASIGEWNDLADVARHTAAIADKVR